MLYFILGSSVGIVVGIIIAIWVLVCCSNDPDGWD